MVRNGTIRGFFIGVHSGGSGGGIVGRNVLEGLRVAHSDQTGMEISSAGDIVRDNVVTSVGGGLSQVVGISVSRPQVRIINNDVETVGDDARAGIWLFPGSVAINNRITHVTGGSAASASSVTVAARSATTS